MKEMIGKRECHNGGYKGVDKQSLARTSGDHRPSGRLRGANLRMARSLALIIDVSFAWMFLNVIASPASPLSISSTWCDGSRGFVSFNFGCRVTTYGR